MWSSSGRNNSNNKDNDSNNNNRISRSPSKSSSTCSSPSPFSPSSSNANASTRKSMEEVWKDINLASLHNHSDTTTTTTTNITTNRTSFPGLILQDFFARPFNKVPPPPPPVTTAAAQSKGAAVSNNEPSSPLEDITASFGSLVPPPKATMLSLNASSGCDYQFLENSGHIRPNQTRHFHTHVGLGSCSFGASQNSPFDDLDSPTPFHSLCKKRPQDNDDNSDDRRHKRMIKNRESAARSRARKQAYTNELELEVAQLVKENARLRRQLDKLLAASEKLPKKHSLYRTTTAPF